MATSQLFSISNCTPAAAAAVNGANGTVGGARGRSLKMRTHLCHRPRTMASADREKAPEETRREFCRERGSRRGSQFRGRRHTPFDLFGSVFPNRNMKFMIEKMDRAFDDPFFAQNWMMSGGRSVGTARPPWDFVETEEAYKLRLDLPGWSKEEVKVYVEDGILVIKGEHSEAKMADESEWASRSQTSQANTRIVLPENADAEMIKAELKDGVLSVTIPKVVKEETKNLIDIQVE